MAAGAGHALTARRSDRGADRLDEGMTAAAGTGGRLRPACRLPEAFGRTEYRPGELAQWDLLFPDFAGPVRGPATGTRSGASAEMS